jgi:uroporphyrinogen decarboxylase
VDGLGCDTGMTTEHMGRLAREHKIVVQGNLDPLALLAGGETLEREAEGILRGLAGVPHVFNLGHGILPETPPEHVARLVTLVRGS